MKNLFLILILFTSLSLISQPFLKRVYDRPSLPKLNIEMLKQNKNCLTFQHEEGVVLYSEKTDEWKLYKYVDKYEDFGRIIRIQYLDNIFIVSLERVSLIVLKTEIKVIKACFLNTVSKKNHLLILSSKPSNKESSSYGFNYKTAEQMIIFDLRSDSINIVELTKPIYNIRSCEFFKNQLWITNFNDQGEYWSPGLFVVDSTGNVSEKKISTLGYNSNLLLNSYDDKLFLLSDSSLFQIKEEDSFEKVINVDLPRNYISIKTYNYFNAINRVDNSQKDFHISKIDLNHNTISDDTVTISTTSSSIHFIDYTIYNNQLFCFSHSLNEVIGLDIDEPTINKRYYIRDGITGSLLNIAEDKEEIWFVCMYSGIHRYVKKDSAWYTYNQYLDIKSDSVTFLQHSQISLNEEFVFIPLANNSRLILKYLIFDRETSVFTILSKKEFVNNFFFRKGQFTKYDGEPFVNDNQQDFLLSIFEEIHEWYLLLFLYDLSLSGLDSWTFGNRIIRTDAYSILSIYVNMPGTYYKGILLMNKPNKELILYKFPRYVEDFDSSIVPYLITGDNKKIFISGQGNSSKGLFFYNLQDKSYRADRNWYNKFQDFSFVRNFENGIFIGTFKAKLYSLNKTNYNVTDFSKYLSKRPRDCESTDNYIYVSTFSELLRFDNNFKYLGKFETGQSNLYKTDENLYLYNLKAIYEVCEE